MRLAAAAKSAASSSIDCVPPAASSSIATDPALKQKAQLRRAEVEIARGRKDLAVGRLRDFRKDWPGSPLLPEVDKLLEALKPGSS